MSTTPTIEAFISTLSAEGKVCPLPEKWNQLWQMLPNRRQIGANWEPSIPLILAAWHHTSDAEKRERLALHLQWAEQHQQLPKIIEYLGTLKPEDWHSQL
jgi:hypothetical protein